MDRPQMNTDKLEFTLTREQMAFITNRLLGVHPLDKGNAKMQAEILAMAGIDYMAYRKTLNLSDWRD